jgi:hypothetical protein
MSERLKKYIANQKKLGRKRVSFFVDEKLWKFINKQCKKQNITINEFLKDSLDFD